MDELINDKHSVKTRGNVNVTHAVNTFGIQVFP